MVCLMLDLTISAKSQSSFDSERNNRRNSCSNLEIMCPMPNDKRVILKLDFEYHVGFPGECVIFRYLYGRKTTS